MPKIVAESRAVRTLKKKKALKECGHNNFRRWSHLSPGLWSSQDRLIEHPTSLPKKLRALDHSNCSVVGSRLRRRRRRRRQRDRQTKEEEEEEEELRKQRPRPQARRRRLLSGRGASVRVVEVSLQWHESVRRLETSSLRRCRIASCCCCCLPRRRSAKEGRVLWTASNAVRSLVCRRRNCCHHPPKKEAPESRTSSFLVLT